VVSGKQDLNVQEGLYRRMIFEVGIMLIPENNSSVAVGEKVSGIAFLSSHRLSIPRSTTYYELK